MENNIFYQNKAEFDQKITQIKKEGKDSLHIIADFDRTLTKCFVNGEKFKSLISILREKGYLGEEYSKKSFELYNTYYPIEVDETISLETKNEKMNEWWVKHVEVMKEFRLNKKDMQKAIIETKPVLRENTKEFFDLLEENDIPILILSASFDTLIKESLKVNKITHKNINIITNNFTFDENEYVTGLSGNIIQVFNKSETSITDENIKKSFEKRKNVILLGDSLGDPNMADGIDHNNVLKIGFCNDKGKEELYLKHYDVIITNDGPMDFIIETIKKIIE